MVTQYGFYHNNDECIGCRDCVIACKDKNDLPLGEKYRRVYDYAGGTWDVSEDGICTQNNAFAYSVSIACNHCASPACQAVCPADAIKKRDDGVVYVDSAACIGCGSCVTACPYGAPYVSKEQGVARKCDLCMDLLDEGEVPVCIESCPMRCLNYGELDGLKSQYGGVQSVAPITEDLSTGPSVVFKRSRLNPDGTLLGVMLNAPEEIESAAVE